MRKQDSAVEISPQIVGRLRRNRTLSSEFWRLEGRHDSAARMSAPYEDRTRLNWETTSLRRQSHHGAIGFAIREARLVNIVSCLVKVSSAGVEPARSRFRKPPPIRSASRTSSGLLRGDVRGSHPPETDSQSALVTRPATPPCVRVAAPPVGIEPTPSA